MKDFDQILDECIDDMASGSATLEQCLVRHPEEADQLEPLLRAALGLSRSQELHPSAAFKVSARMRLARHMVEHPRSVVTPQRMPTPVRVVFSLTVLLLALLISGTAYAQGSLPGDSFYSWKITSERAWRAFSTDPIGIDLVLAERRVSEYRSVAGDPVRSERALQGYSEVIYRLQAESDENTRGRIEPVLKNQDQSLKETGVTVPALVEYLAGPPAWNNNDASNSSQTAPASNQQSAGKPGEATPTAVTPLSTPGLITTP
jgi:hypothetical protein